MKIGVLALQGAFAEHRKMLKKLGIESFEIRKKSDLSNAVNNNDIDGLIIPGGESTVIGKLLYDLDLFDDIKKLILEGLPVFGTCAGLILLAKEIENDNRSYFGVMDIKVRRNAYGRQLGSFFTESEFKGVGVKVANCVLLFAYHRIGAFPIDVWVEKILNNHYNKSFPMDRYKGYAGVLQQYMFFYEREMSNVKLK